MKLLFVLIIIVNNAFAQNDTTVCKTYFKDGSVCEKYQTTLPDSARNGYYKEYVYTGLLIVDGWYTNNKRTGVWNFYKGNHLYEKYDYSNDVESFYDSTYEENVGKPHFPGGRNEFSNYLSERCHYELPSSKLKQYSGKKVYFSLDINDNGIISNIRSFKEMNSINDSEFENEIIKIINEAPKWMRSKNHSGENKIETYLLPLSIE